MSASADAPTLGSELVRLDPIGPAEARAIIGGRSDPGVPWEAGFPSDALLEFLEKALRDGGLFGAFYAYVIVRLSDGLAVGDVGFHGPPGPEGAIEVGYALAPAARGAGLARDAVKLLLDWAMAQPEVDHVTARVDESNEHREPSERILVSLGFVLDGASDAMRRFVLR